MVESKYDRKIQYQFKIVQLRYPIYAETSHKVEEVYRNEYRSLAEGKSGRELYRVWYENERVHQNLSYRTPHEVYEAQKMNLDLNIKMTNINQAPLCPK